jgi:predicted membrane protein
MILIGSFGLADKIDPSLDLRRFTLPIIFIAIGAMFILRPKRSCRSKWNRYHGDNDKWNDASSATNETTATDQAYESNMGDRKDFVEVTAVFGGIKKNVLSKTFKGGDIVSFMGGSEIDLTQADFSGRIKIDVTNIFGGTKLIVPPNWDVQSDITAIFGGVDDKRQISGVNLDLNKILILDGTCMFGGIEIRSF